SKAMAKRMALMAQDALAIAIRPAHTLYDGDTVFAMSTGDGTALSPETQSAELNAVFVAGTDTLARAIVLAVRHASSAGARQSYCGKYPKACE
ncbi:MAG: P1 family peptidase, partial [Rhodanobacteraceae bacterium]